MGARKERPMKRGRATLAELEARQSVPGIFRTTLSYHDASMLCHFRMQTGARIPLHEHDPAQHGYVMHGRVRFLLGDGTSFEASAGMSYLFESHERHGAEVLEDAEVLEIFTPMRAEYADN
jgi:quercetin dioxygenase-like cupin family protein